MISHIRGKLKKKQNMSVIVDTGSVCYEVLVPQIIMQSLDKSSLSDGTIEFVTYHYLQGDPSRTIPVLVGFLNEIEKEFFEQFITVSGVGPKAACRALALSFSVIAEAIDKGDMALLKTLPGIGGQKAREIIAKLQGKVGKFCLMQDRFLEDSPKIKEDIKEEALNVLTQLQYKKNEAGDMIEKAIRRNPGVSSCEEILNEVYRGSKTKV